MASCLVFHNQKLLETKKFSRPGPLFNHSRADPGRGPSLVASQRSTKLGYRPAPVRLGFLDVPHFSTVVFRSIRDSFYVQFSATTTALAESSFQPFDPPRRLFLEGGNLSVARREHRVSRGGRCASEYPEYATHLPAYVHCKCHCSRWLNLKCTNYGARLSRWLKFVLLNTCDLNARHFPLWKRGTKGDLRSLSTR